MTIGHIALLKQDLLFLWVAATTALCLGLVLNQFRDEPITLVYQGKQQRLQNAVERLTSASGSAEPVTALVADFPEFFTLAEFSKFAEGGEGLILDARPEIFHRLGHVPGAISLPRDDFENAYKGLREMLEADKARAIVLYCSGASCEDSELVKRSLLALGFTRLAIFKGGWSEWTAAGRPEESGMK